MQNLSLVKGGLCVLCAGLVLSPSLASAATNPYYWQDVPTAPTQVQTMELDQESAAFLPKINEFRAQNGLGELKVSHMLTQAALDKSKDMGQKGYFSHSSPDGRDVASRLAQYGYRGTYGENIAAGYTSAEEAFQAWQNSPGHRANMLSPNYTAIGIGRVEVPGSQYGTYWTTEFGANVNDEVAYQNSATAPASFTGESQPSQYMDNAWNSQITLPTVAALDTTAAPVNTYYEFPQQGQNVSSPQNIQTIPPASTLSVANTTQATQQQQEPGWYSFCSYMWAKLNGSK